MTAFFHGRKRRFAGPGATAWLLPVLLAASLGAQAQTVTNTTTGSDTKPPLVITLQDAIARAKANDPKFRAALTELGLAHQDVVQSRAGLLPNVSYNMQFVYTQGAVIRILQGAVTLPTTACTSTSRRAMCTRRCRRACWRNIARSEAAEALARAKSEMAARGLVVTVVQAYYGYVVAQRKYATAQKARLRKPTTSSTSARNCRTAARWPTPTSSRPRIQDQQQQRDLQDALLAMNKSRLDLAVLLFPDFDQNFSVVDDLAPARSAARALPKCRLPPPRTTLKSAPPSRLCAKRSRK